MTEREKKTMLWMTIAVAVIIIIILLLRRFHGVASGPVSLSVNIPPSNYLSYNFPSDRNPVGSATGLPTIPAMSENDCGCGSGSSGFYTSTQQMLDSFMNGATAAFNTYEDNVYAGYPDSVTQYFNNPVGARFSMSARETFESR